jgi:predicted RNA-binding protein (virulence factor B family)
MSEVIGELAGQVWQYLAENGESSINKISTDTGMAKNDIQRAIGWLAREDKILVATKGRTETVVLV